MRRYFFTLLAALGLLGITATPASALVITNNSIFTSQDENVFVSFVSYSAAHTNLLFEAAPGLMYLFTNNTTPPGTIIDLGSFFTGEELIFQLNNQNTGDSYFTGPATDNPDLTLHVTYTDLGSNTRRVGFEDLPNGGDFDYNDLIFDIWGVPTGPDPDPDPVVPEPATLALVGLGLSCAGLVRRKRKA